MKRLIAIVLLLIAAGCAKKPAPETADGPLSLKITLSTNVIHVGDTVTLNLDAIHPTGTVLRIPEVSRG